MALWKYLIYPENVWMHLKINTGLLKLKSCWRVLEMTVEFWLSLRIWNFVNVVNVISFRIKKNFKILQARSIQKKLILYFKDNLSCKRKIKPQESYNATTIECSVMRWARALSWLKLFLNRPHLKKNSWSSVFGGGRFVDMTHVQLRDLFCECLRKEKRRALHLNGWLRVVT